MDGGGDNQRAVRFFRSQEQRRRLQAHRQRRVAPYNIAGIPLAVPAPAAAPAAGPSTNAANHRAPVPALGHPDPANAVQAGEYS